MSELKLPKYLRDAKFLQINQEVQKLSLDYINSFAKSFYENRKGVLILGPTNSGKSYIAAAMLKELIKRGFPGYWANTIEFAEKYSNFRYFRKMEEFHEISQKLDYPIFVFDAIDNAEVDENVIKLVTRLILYRIQKGYPSIITANYDDWADIAAAFNIKFVETLKSNTGLLLRLKG